MAGVDSLHAALLIDFDNVTMGMRSDLSKELKRLLDSDVIKGKVSVQRAYADWRRYPQYIVPLSEASVDLIFAPAYGSNKKNATDIRMAIDALELVFIRPEIGTYILLTGDSDFSSLVLKLKEYGKYVIGVGIQESSSDILVQNCDEYYSYTSLTGLTKTTELGSNTSDPWVLVKEAVQRMVKRSDVMRSDRLKQVMQEIDPNFDEGSIGFSKFSKFLAEAASRGLVKLQKMDNGQYEIEPTSGGGGGGGRSRSRDESRGRRDRGRGGRRGGRDRSSRSEGDRPDESASSGAEAADADASDEGPDPLSDAYDTLRDALTTLRDQGRHPVRDSDVKRKMLEIRRSFDETELGFSKFSKFLQQAVEHGVIHLERTEAGNLDVSLAGPGAPAPEADRSDDDADEGRDTAARAQERPASEEASEPETSAGDEGPTVIDVEPPKRGIFGFLGPRRGTTRRRDTEDSSFFGFGGSSDKASDGKDAEETPAGTAADARGNGSGAAEQAEPEAAPEPDRSGAGASASAASSASAGDIDWDDLGLPADEGALVRYLAHRYKGVGEKTAETLVEEFGMDLFRTMHENPAAIARTVPPKRAEQVLDAWQADFARRMGRS
jgi:uncharacterized protein (TIGR00288 family)